MDGSDITINSKFLDVFFAILLSVWALVAPILGAVNGRRSHEKTTCCRLASTTIRDKNLYKEPVQEKKLACRF